jgi:hypothetical protein
MPVHRGGMMVRGRFRIWARRRWFVILFVLSASFLFLACGAGMVVIIHTIALLALTLSSSDNVFFCTPTYPFYLVPELIISFPIGLMTPFFLFWMVPTFRSRLKNEAAELIPLIRIKWALAIFCMYLFLVLLYLFGLSSNVCLSDSEIYYRPNIFVPLRTYALSQIAEVRPRCTFPTRSWLPGLEIRMADGASFNLAAVWPLYFASSERILGLLANAPLNTSEISPDCPNDLKLLITPR